MRDKPEPSVSGNSQSFRAATSELRAAPRSIAVDVLCELAKNVGMGIPPVRAWRLKRPRAGAFFSGCEDELERYAFFPLRHLLRFRGTVRGLDILEIGPGDFMTSGLALLAAGAKSYTVVDRFIGNYQAPQAKTWYRGIRAAWPRLFPALPWPEDLQAEDFPEAYQNRVKILVGTTEQVRAEKRYDVVCSFQVGEHVSDIDAFARTNAQLLKPGATALHRVDFGPHDCWYQYPDPLTFLRFPGWLWKLMGSNRGIPNRHRHHEFCAAFARAGMQYTVENVDHFPDRVIDQSRLSKRFRHMPPESLATRTAIYACRVGDSPHP